MSTAETVANLEPEAPSAFSRVLLVFSAPSRAFENLGGGGNWWLPYLLIVVVSLGFFAAVGSKVGWETVARTNMASSPKQQAKLDTLPADQQTAAYGNIAKITKISGYAGSVLGPLLVAAVVSGVLLATLNFGFGGGAKFGQLFAAYFYAALPAVIKSLLIIATLFAGLGGDNFHLAYPLGSNPAYYLQGSSLPRWAISALSWFDVFLIWQVVLLGIACSVIAKVSRGKGLAAVFGWTVLVLLISTAVSALN